MSICWQRRRILAVFLLLAILLNYLAFYTPKAQASGNPTIEQQINIINSTGLTSGFNSSAGIVYADTTKYTGATYYFEIYGCTSSGTGTVTLTYGAGAGSLPTGGSTVSISNVGTTCQRYRSSSFSLTTGNAYISAFTGSVYELDMARIIIVQTSSTAITDTQTQFDIPTSGTISSTTDNLVSNPWPIWYYDSSKYSGTVHIYFEATLTGDGTHAANASLYSTQSGSSCVSKVTNSTVSNSASSSQRMRSADITANLSSGTEYMVCVSNTTSNNGQQIANAKVIIEQTAAGGLTNMELPNYYDLSDATGGSGYDDQYNPSDWAGGTFTYYFEDSMDVTSGTGQASLYNDTDSSTITTLSTTSTSTTRVRSSSLTMPSSAKDLVSNGYTNSGAGTTTVAVTRLIIDVSSLANGSGAADGSWLILPLIPLLPKLARFLLAARRKKK